MLAGTILVGTLAILFVGFIIWIQHQTGKTLMFFKLSTREDNPRIFYVAQTAFSLLLIYIVFELISEIFRLITA